MIPFRGHSYIFQRTYATQHASLRVFVLLSKLFRKNGRLCRGRKNAIFYTSFCHAKNMEEFYRKELHFWGKMNVIFKKRAPDFFFTCLAVFGKLIVLLFQLPSFYPQQKQSLSWIMQVFL